MLREPSPTFSDDEEELDQQNQQQQQNNGAILSTSYDLKGILNKWTNYIHGWQNRYIILKDGNLSYYKSEDDLNFGCRGAISILKAAIKPHEFDECRFDVSVNDCVWYLRAENPEEKAKWVEALEHYKVESGYGSQNSLRRHGSAVSISSNTHSITSTSSFKKGRGLKVKLAELETYRDILVQQIETLQKYFDISAVNNSNSTISNNINNDNKGFETGAPLFSNLNGGLDEDIETETPTPTTAEVESPFFTQQINKDNLADALSKSELRLVDFRGEALTFKATTAGILTSLSHCIEVMSQREDTWRKRLERETDKRKKIEEYFKVALKDVQDQKKVVVMGGPDCEEGPHSTLNEDEFYDAVEQGLDRLDEENAFRERLKSIQLAPSVSKAQSHTLWSDIDRITLSQLHYAQLGVGDGGWELFSEDGEMRMYKREEEIGDLVVDPLKAVHTVRGITGHEMCHYFFSPDVRMEWETTLENMTILEKISEDTLVFLQIHKRVWPSTQRDAVFWSHMRQIKDDPNAPNLWIVTNQSTEHILSPEKNNGKYIRVYLTVSLVCQTVIDPPKKGSDVTRDNLSCKITYCSVVNPGGWVPSSALRAVYKREYPKFLKKFTQYVCDKTKEKPILF